MRKVLENAGQWAEGEIYSQRKTPPSNNVILLKKQNKFTIEIVVNIYNYSFFWNLAKNNL